MSDERPEPLPARLTRSRLLLGIGLVVAGVALVPVGLLLAAAAMDAGVRGRGAGLAAAPGVVGLFFVGWGIRQLWGLVAVARGERWWAFVEVREVERQVPSGCLGLRRTPMAECFVELRTTTDERIVGYVRTTCDRAHRIARDGVVGVYGMPRPGARVVLSGWFGVMWQLTTIQVTI